MLFFFLLGFLGAALLTMLLPIRPLAVLLSGSVPIAAVIALAYAEPDPRGEGVTDLPLPLTLMFLVVIPSLVWAAGVGAGLALRRLRPSRRTARPNRPQ